MKLINDILDMSRIDSGKLSLAKEPFSLESILDGIRMMMESEGAEKGPDFSHWKRIWSTAVLSVTVFVCGRCLSNLLSNAFKFTPAGGNVYLRVMEEGGTEEEASLYFRVIDTGTGITPEDQKRIFESFEQGGHQLLKKARARGWDLLSAEVLSGKWGEN